MRIRKENGSWNASVNYWKPPVDAGEKTHLCRAVDVGITPLAVDSQLVHYENPKALGQSLRKLARWQRVLARRTVGSRGWHEAQRRVAAIHRRIIGLRENGRHQVSRLLVRKYAVLAIESLTRRAWTSFPIRPELSATLPSEDCCSRSAIRLTGTELSSWKQTGSSHPASSAPTAALTTPRWVGNHTGPAPAAACNTTATRTPRSTCWVWR